MRAIILGVSLSFAASIASAQYLSTNPTFQPFGAQQQTFPQTSTTYDWKSGNRYTTTINPDGSAQVRGSNLQNGTSWRSTIQPDGQQRGTDADGNQWRYNPRTKTYTNFGTGKTCTDTAYGRVCN